MEHAAPIAGAAWSLLVELVRGPAGILLGGAGGVLLVWWLDGKRVSARERRSLIGALELVSMELSANVAYADMWVAQGDPDRARPDVGPIELKSWSWQTNANELARALPRDIVGQLVAGYELTRWLMHNASVAKQRGSLVEEDIKLARRVRDMQQASLRQLQNVVRDLGVDFTIEPVAPWEARLRE